jgi:hypothetical protein
MGRSARGLADVVEMKPEPIDQAAVVAWVRASCEEQGITEKVSDPTILRKVAVLLRPALAGLPVPNRRYSRRVKPIPAADRGPNQNVVENSSDDVSLPGKGQPAPLVAQEGRVGEIAGEGGGSAVDVEGSSS